MSEKTTSQALLCVLISISMVLLQPHSPSSSSSSSFQTNIQEHINTTTTEPVLGPLPTASPSPSQIPTSSPPPVHLTEDRAVLHSKITFIDHYFTFETDHAGAESSNSQHHDEDETYVFLGEGGPSEDPAIHKTERLKALIKTTIRKWLPLVRRAGNHFEYEFLTHQVLGICRIGYQINFNIPFFTQYLKQLLDKLPEDDGRGNEFAEAIEEIANKLLEIAGACRETPSTRTNEEGQ